VRAGFHTADITPALGMEKPGGYGKSYVQQIHDPLKVRAAVFEHEGTTLAFVGVDTCDLPLANRYVGDVRQMIERQCGIPVGNVMLGASHTHSGGPLSWFELSAFAGAPELVRTLVRDHSTNPDPLYLDWVQRQIVTAVSEAQRQRVEVRLSVGSGREEESAFNRRFTMANGRVYTHPGKGNPDIVAPAGPIDPEVGVLAAWTGADELLGCVVTFGCHCTTFSGGVSADYVSYLEQTAQGVMGRQAGVVFLQGASGDVTQVDNRSLRPSEHGER
jgi:neutral ceramidase